MKPEVTRRVMWILVVLVFVGGCTLVGPIPDPPIRLPAASGDVRALWVVRTALLHPDSARVAVQRAHEAGFNTLLVQVGGRGDAYYDSRWEPWPDPPDGSVLEYDPPATVLDEAGRLGLAVPP